MKYAKTLAILVSAGLVTAVAYQTYQILAKGDRSLAGIGRFAGKKPPAAAGEPPETQPDEPAALPVRVVLVRTGRVRDTIRQTATLAAERSTSVFAPQAGIIVEVLVEEGDRVARGQTLLRLDDRELALNLERAQINLEREKEEWERQREINRKALTDRTEYRDAKYAYETKRVLLSRLLNEQKRRESEAHRFEVSFQEQLASEKERDEARFALEQAGFEVKQTRIELQRAEEEWTRVRALDANALIDEAAYSRAKFAFQEARAEHRLTAFRLSQARVEAPQPGVVVALDVDEGDFVSSNTRLLILEDLARLEAELLLPEAQWAAVRPGQPVAIRPEALPGLDVTGVVKRVSPTIDPANGTFKVTVSVDSKRFPQVMPGMFATLHIQTASRSGALLVPRQAVLGEEDERYIYVVEREHARRRLVRLGAVEGELVEVLRGVAAGESVVVMGQYGLKPGNRVRTLDEAQTGGSAPRGTGRRARKP